MFVASMSHELRTPLNSIIGFIGVVLQGISGDLNTAQKGQLDRAYESSKHLLLLISDVLDVSKIEAGFLQLNTEKFELKPVLSELEHAVQHLMTGKTVALSFDCADNLRLVTDRKRLYQVLLNVLSNAVKYTEQGSVIVSACIENEQLRIACKDTGIGIAETDFDKLFQPFERVESPLKIKTSGTGLGLYLSHKIVTQLLGGHIEVNSKLGQGSMFTIIMPINTPLVAAQKMSVVIETNAEESV
jgi:signal transduction histidine kinase